MASTRVSRSKETIIIGVLTATLEPTKKTIIMYSARIGYAQLVRYLEFLSAKQLIETRDELWVTTEKGREYLKRHQKNLVANGSRKLE